MTITTSGNSTLSQDIVERILLAPLAQASSFLSAGFPVYVSDGNPVRLPALDSIGTATGFVAEGAEIAEASVATGEVVLLESSVYAIKAMVKMSQESVDTSVINLESAMAQAITGRVSQLVDAALINGGTATTGSPVGIFQITGYTNAGTAAGTALTSSVLIDMTTDYLTAGVDEARALWMVSPTNLGRIRKLTDDVGQRVLQPSLAEGRPNRILGYDYLVSTHVPDDAIVLLDRSQIAVGRAPAAVRVLDQTFADYGQIGISVNARYDVKALHPAAIVKLAIS